MHSTLVRAQNVFGFFTSVAFCVAALVALSVVISPQAPAASIELRNIQVSVTAILTKTSTNRLLLLESKAVHIITPPRRTSTHTLSLISMRVDSPFCSCSESLTKLTIHPKSQTCPPYLIGTPNSSSSTSSPPIRPSPLHRLLPKP